MGGVDALTLTDCTASAFSEANVCKTCFTEMPRVQRPCRIGRGKLAEAAASGSICSCTVSSMKYRSRLSNCGDAAHHIQLSYIIGETLRRHALAWSNTLSHKVWCPAHRIEVSVEAVQGCLPDLCRLSHAEVGRPRRGVIQSCSGSVSLRRHPLHIAKASYRAEQAQNVCLIPFPRHLQK